MTSANAIIEVASRTRNKEWTTVVFLAGPTATTIAPQATSHLSNRATFLRTRENAPCRFCFWGCFWFCFCFVGRRTKGEYMQHGGNICIDFAFVLAVIATFFNYDYNGQPGPWYQGRFYVHAGWGAVALCIASIIW